MKSKLVIVVCVICLLVSVGCSLDKLLYGNAPSDVVVERFFNTQFQDTKVNVDGSHVALIASVSGSSSYTGIMAGGVEVTYESTAKFGYETFKFTLFLDGNTLTIDGSCAPNTSSSYDEVYRYNGDVITKNKLSDTNRIMFDVANYITIYNLHNYAKLSGSSTMTTTSGDTIERTMTYDGSNYNGTLKYTGSISYNIEIDGIMNSYKDGLSKYESFKLKDKPLNSEQMSANSSNIGNLIVNDAFLGL